ITDDLASRADTKLGRAIWIGSRRCRKLRMRICISLDSIIPNRVSFMGRRDVKTTE
nr:hypothetical protein [Tanacetum cinerariifolium]